MGYLNSVSVILSVSIRDQYIERSVDLTEILSVELLTSETSVVEVPYQHKRQMVCLFKLILTILVCTSSVEPSLCILSAFLFGS